MEIQFYISTKCKKDFSDTVFQHFVNELKHRNPSIYANELTTSSSIFGCYLIYLVTMLPLRMISLDKVSCFILFCVNLKYFSPL